MKTIASFTLRAVAVLTVSMALICPHHAAGQNVIAWGNNALTNVPASATNVIAVAAGYHHVLALRRDGTVVGWGTGPEAIVPAEATNIVAVAVGLRHSLALKSDGNVLAWGGNDRGQLNVPPEATNLVAIAARNHGSLGIRADGTLVGWTNYIGYYPGVVVSNVMDISGTLGYDYGSFYDDDWGWILFEKGRIADIRGRYVSRYTARLLGDVQTISTGVIQSLGLLAGGQVVATKNIYYRSIFPPVTARATNVVLIAAGTNDHMAVSARGELMMWGHTSLTNAPASATNLVAIGIGPDYCLAAVGDLCPPSILARNSVVYQSQVSMGSPLPLYVRAIGSQPLHYEWQADGVPIPNSDSPFPQIPAEFGTDEVEYRVRVYNDFGSVTSEPGKVAVGRIYAWGDNRQRQRDYPPGLSNAVSLAAGAFHALALREDGTVVGWGKNADGQTNVPAGLTDVIGIAAGGDHSLALKSDGTVVSWGRNWDGQTSPPTDASNIRGISAGWAHSLALRSDGRVVAWGNNDYGQTNVALQPKDLVVVAAGYFHSAGLRENGTVVTWGWEVPVPSAATNVVSIAAGWEHCLALRGDGTVVAWGDNTYGQSTVPADATNIVAIAAGYYHNLARRADGSVVTWGRNAFGAATVSPFLRGATCVAAGEDYSLALIGRGAPRVIRQPASMTAHVGQTRALSAEVAGEWPITFQWLHDGNVVTDATNAWLALPNVTLADAGSYRLQASNALGQASSLPVTLTVLQSPDTEITSSTQSVLVGGSFCLQATAGGAAPVSYRWQLNGMDLNDGPGITGATTAQLCITSAAFDQSGAYSFVVRNPYGSITTLVAQVSVSTLVAWGDNSAGQLNVPVGEADVRQISAGGAHNLLLRGNGTVVAWGDNSFGQTDVPLAATNAVAVAAGAQHSIALLADGTVLAWGDNSRGQTQFPVFDPKPVAIAAGDFHNLALLGNGTVAAWGKVVGQTNVLPQGTNVIAIAAGGDQSFALTADHVLIGLRYGFPSYPPPGSWNIASNIVAIAAGSRHVLALRDDGILLGFGNNAYGQRTIPNTATNLIAIAAGADHSLALRGDGTVLGWGADYASQSDIPALPNVRVLAVGGGCAHTLALSSFGVQPRPLLLEVVSNPNLTNTAMMLRLNGLSGTGRSVIYASEELVGWSSMATNLPTLGPLHYLDYPNADRFYRAVEQR